MKEKINIKKGFTQTLLLVAVIFSVVVITGISYSVLECQKISKTMAEADRLTKEKKYDNAISELESIQGKLFVKNLSFKRQEITLKIEENRQLLRDQMAYNDGMGKIKERDWNKAKELLLNVSDKSPFYSNAKNKIDILGEILDCKYRKGEYRMKVTDSQGRVTGVVDGEIKEEIPSSVFDEENNTVMIFYPSGSYIYDFYAVEGGNYQFSFASILEGEVTNFYLQNIPILSGASHRIQVDEEAIKEGKKGGILSIDVDSNGEFEEKITFGKQLTCEEFIVRTKMPEIEIDFPEITDLKMEI